MEPRHRDRSGAPGLDLVRVLVLVLLLFGSVRSESGRKVCEGSRNGLSRIGPPQTHYENLVRTFSNCTIVLENLEITHTLPEHDLSFLQSIEEVGGYVLIALNQADLVPLTSLRLIRGQSLYQGNFSLLVLANSHREEEAEGFTSGVRRLQLNQLTEILAGGVKITRNHLLCHLDSIQWWEILDKNLDPQLEINTEVQPKDCPSCDESCVNGACWAPGPQHCQKFSRLICADQCSRRCHGPEPSDCCHDQCAAGCTGPHATHCLACRSFSDDGECKESCPSRIVYDVKTHLIVPNPHGKFTFGATCVKSCPHNYVVTDWACVRSCRPGKHEVLENGVHRCKDCDGACPKACEGTGTGALADAISVDASNIESFRNCTKIIGDLKILTTAFNGDAVYKTPPLDLSKLDYFRTLREITGSLIVMDWPENLTSLSVFENLEVIRGRSLYRGFSLLVAKAGRIQSLGLRSLKEISDGNVILKDNSELCYISQLQWGALFQSPGQKAHLVGNASPYNCSLVNAVCDPQCSADGCWGPGASHCVSCLHLDHRGRCVERCNLYTGFPREVELSGRCVSCHSQCAVQDNAPSCTGPGPDQCVRCAAVQDGPHCVAQCPQGVLVQGNQLIWKYPDDREQCQPCHTNCTKGCTGPGLSNCIQVHV